MKEDSQMASTNKNNMIYDTTIKSAERAGKRIRKIRTEQGLSQGELGQSVNLNANRIQQYEGGSRKAKFELMQKIADALDVCVEALMDPTTDDCTSIMYAFFELEEKYNLRLKKIDGKIYLYFDEPPTKNISSLETVALNESLESWFERQTILEEQLNTSKTDEEKQQFLHEYKLWKWNFRNYANEKTEKELEKALINKTIERLQNKLAQMDTDNK